MNKITVVTGLSGAGKSTLANILEDMGMFCVDNIPPNLLQALALEAGKLQDKEIVAVMDARTVKCFGEFSKLIVQLKKQGIFCRVIFLEASTEAIMMRYNLTRRSHPLSGEMPLSAAVKEERRMMEPIRAMADLLLDTGDMSVAELRKAVFELLTPNEEKDAFTVMVMSFGFKYGIPLDCNCIFDARLLPNPWHVPELRPLSGKDAKARDYIFSLSAASEFLHLQSEFLKYTLPLYRKEGRMVFTVGEGCTGGRHRSVALAESLSEILKSEGYKVLTRHRDMYNDAANARKQDLKDEDHKSKE